MSILNLTVEKTAELIKLVEQIYPDWQGFSDPQFENDEIEYKQLAVSVAQELLPQEKLEGFLKQENYADFKHTLWKVAQGGKNLLFLSVPKQSDLGILEVENIDKVLFMQEFINLIYGDGDSPDRLERYLSYVQGANLPNKWTFPTYFLYLCHPDTDVYIKPRYTKKYLEFFGLRKKYSSKPSKETYELILEIAEELKSALSSYNPRDMVDIQSFLWVMVHSLEKQSNNVGKVDKKLAEPFSKMFKNLEQANQGFDLLKMVLNKITSHVSNDKLYSVTIRKIKDQYKIRINLGSWLIFGLNGNTKGIFSLDFLHLTEKMDSYILSSGKFKQKENEIQISVSDVLFSNYLNHSEQINSDFEEALSIALKRFSTWKGSPYRHAHNQEIENAIFDLEYRKELFEQGLDLITEDDGNLDIETGIEKLNGFFDEESFSLLALLEKNPSASVYHEHKDKFKAKVEEPLQKLMKHSLDFLNEDILETMETEKGLFSRILKNDYGRGGAWSFYWGVFYPKNTHKNSSARLATAITTSHFGIGISFGYDSIKAKNRFDKNCRENLTTVTELIENIFSDQEYLLADPEKTTYDEDGVADSESQSFTWQEWLKYPEMSKYEVTKVYPKNQVIQMTFEELVEEVSGVFNQLFPLILLAIEDDPMPKIFDFLEITPAKTPQPEYTISMVADDTGFQESELRRWIKAIHRKGQAVIYGPPGTGKTFIAEKLARHLIGGGDGFFELIQFHPEVSYEDFIQGIRPEQHPVGGLHYPVVAGRFLKFCDKASSRKDTCVLIIDEINRANLARVFGELMYLLEYRENSINLSAGTSFSIPKNVRIIGTMNTADRSIALVDHALRRRFAFLALYPDFEILRKYHQRELTGTPVAGLIEVLKNLNDEIQDKHYMIGPSYFLRKDLEVQIEDIWRMEIEPYLEEFFFDQQDKYKKFTWDNVSARIL